MAIGIKMIFKTISAWFFFLPEFLHNFYCLFLCPLPACCLVCWDPYRLHESSSKHNALSLCRPPKSKRPMMNLKQRYEFYSALPFGEVECGIPFIPNNYSPKQNILIHQYKGFSTYLPSKKLILAFQRPLKTFAETYI